MSLACRDSNRFPLAGPIGNSDMVKMKFATLARVAPALALFSCAAPKALVVERAPAPKMETAPPTVPEPPAPSAPDDGIRLPDMLAMPGEGEFRATTPVPPRAGSEPNAVISRPPTDPPSRPKPKDAE